MRNAMLLRWIEQAEARRVLAAALFERAPKPSWFRMAMEAVSQGLPRMHSRPARGLPVERLTDHSSAYRRCGRLSPAPRSGF